MLLTAKEIANIWGVSQRRVLTLCENGRIEGAEKKGFMWLIPNDAQKPKDARYKTKETKQTKKAKPFLKWVGGKGQLLDAINDFYPFDNEIITKYAEPFVGGGAVLFDVLNNCDVEEVFISDINADLINAYLIIKNHNEELIYQLAKKRDEYLPLEEEERAKYYYKARERFNELKIQEGNELEKAALLIFLNRTCYNGMYRVNKNGQFNVPKGYYKKPMICDEENLMAVSNVLQRVEIVCGDYHCAEGFIDDRTFVYMDPPYRPLTETSSFVGYTENKFMDEEQIELSNFVKEMHGRGAKLLISNSDPEYIDFNDKFFYGLYENEIFRVRKVEAKRMINSKAKERGKISELLISNY